MSILFVIQALFWLVLYSNLVKITNFTSSKFKYLIITKSKFLLLSSCSLVQGSSSCWTSCSALLFVVTSGLVSAFVYFCMLLWSDSFYCIHCILPYTWHCLCSAPCYNIYIFLLPTSLLYSLCCLLLLGPHHDLVTVYLICIFKNC